MKKIRENTYKATVHVSSFCTPYFSHEFRTNRLITSELQQQFIDFQQVKTQQIDFQFNIKLSVLLGIAEKPDRMFFIFILSNYTVFSLSSVKFCKFSMDGRGFYKINSAHSINQSFIRNS